MSLPTRISHPRPPGRSSFGLGEIICFWIPAILIGSTVAYTIYRVIVFIIFIW